jgi:L-asparaginase II
MPEKKSALAVKIIDGARRAAEVAIAGLISELKIINNDKIKKIKKSPVKNSANQIIGITKWVG